MTELGPALIDEFTQLVQQHATAQHYSFAGGISIRLARDETLSEGLVRIDSENVKGDGRLVSRARHRRQAVTRCTKGRTVIGRGSDADITLDDSGTSRKHVEILWDGKRGQVSDLGLDQRLAAQRRPSSPRLRCLRIR